MNHIPVLLNEVIEGLEIKSDSVFIDATLGLGGHSVAIAEKFGKNLKMIGIDKDIDAITEATERVKKVGNKIFTYNGSFAEIAKALDLATKSPKGDLVAKKADAILFDLGISSYQLDESMRGFSFMRDEPLLMTMERAGVNKLSAKEIVNEWDEENIADIIYGYGEERYSRRIAKFIVEYRQTKEINTTFELVEIIKNAVPASYRHQKTHFATRTFQALRIAVNDELQTIKKALSASMEILNIGGRIAVISFHSLEDRIVKRLFKEYKDENIGELITKKPITSSKKEIKENPRSRSAKLRIIEKHDKNKITNKNKYRK